MGNRNKKKERKLSILGKNTPGRFSVFVLMAYQISWSI